MQHTGKDVVNSTTVRRKTLVVFGYPPHIKDTIELEKKERLATKDSLRNELALTWEGVNYLVEEESKQHKRDVCTDRVERMPVHENISLPETSDSSDGVDFNYSFRKYDQPLSWSSDMSVDHYQCIRGSYKAGDEFNVMNGGFSNDKTASLQSEFDFVVSLSQVVPNWKSLSAEQERSNKQNDNRSCNSYDEIVEQKTPGHCNCYHKGITRHSLSVAGHLEIEPLCRARTGKFNILAFVLQVNVERVLRLRNGGYARFAVLYVADIDSDYVKLTLWHDCKNWIRNIDVGCTVVVTDVVQHAWKSQISLATTFSSQLVDFCHVKNGIPCWPEVIRKEIFDDFVYHMERKYPLISRHVGHFPKVNLAENIESFDNLIPGSIVNAVAIVSSIYIHDRKVQVGNQCPETTVWLKDKMGRKIGLSVWQNEPSMLSILRKNHGKWLKFERLAVHTLSNGIDLELHPISDTVVTPYRVSEWSNEYCSEDKKARRDVLEKVKGSIRFIEFLDKKGNNIKISSDLLNKATDNRANDILSSFQDFIYASCSHCFSELENEECRRCLKLSWKYDFKHSDMLRPFKLNIIGESLDPLPVTVFPKDFDRLKGKVPLETILQICKSMKDAPRAVCELKDSIARIFEPKEYVFYVSKEETDGSDTFTKQGMCLLKDVKEK